MALAPGILAIAIVILFVYCYESSNPFQVDALNVTTNLRTWSLTAVFSTQKVFSEMGFYYVDIKEHFAGMVEHYYYCPRLPQVVYETPLEPYTDRLLYYRGMLTVTWSLPKTGGNYYYTGDVVPNGPTEIRIHPKEIEPSPPNTNCPLTYLPEMGHINCQCNTESLGKLVGRLLWLMGNDVIASGGYGATQLQFPTNRVNRTHDGLQVTCQLDWVVKQHVVVAINIAYGPGDVIVQVESHACHVIATCTVDDVKPLVLDMIQWGGLCQGRRGPVCPFTSRGSEDDGKEVTCTVTNHANNGHSISSSVRLTITIDYVATSSNTIVSDAIASDTTAKSVGASVGATLGVLLIVICFVLVAVWIHRRHFAAGPKKKSVNSQTDCQEHYYSGLLKVTVQENAEHNTVNSGYEHNEYQNFPRH